MSKTRVLIIEDEKLIRWSLRQRFVDEGYIADEAETGGEGLRKLRDASYDLITLDYKLPDMTGLDVLREVRRIDGDIVVVMLTAYSNVEDAVTAMRLGAFDYVSKPFKMDELMQTIEHGLETTLLKRQVRDFRAEMKSRFGIEGIIGASPPMLELFAIIRDVASSGASTIFITGESGTGKDLVAKTIHYNSDRADHPFMNITCTAMAETLLESELFGHERGAFTDAKSLKKGLLEVAHGGTVFLDEVGDMPLMLQAKLLRFLEERMFRRVGGVHDIEVDVRVIAATNRDIDKQVEEGRFRNDLYYRLNIIPVHLAPLRQRGSDILLLTKHFVARFSSEFRKPITEIRRDAEEKLMSYTWPGNVREVRNAVERAVLLCKHDYIDADDLVLGRMGEQPGEAIAGLQLPPGGVDLARVEEQLVRQALERTGGNQTHAAALLSLSRDQLRYRLQKYGLL
ncbi:MAG: sigma-54 dependent transcriptional regulator [Planctomycetota bacterium]